MNLDITPDYARMFAIFLRDAKIRAERLGRDLLPTRSDEVKRLEALRTLQAFLAPLNVAAQAMTDERMVMEFRDVLNNALSVVSSAADQLENKLNPEDEDPTDGTGLDIV